jgi:endonuclease/exonuclease/phosphatase family metal-dependent hydrolase
MGKMVQIDFNQKDTNASNSITFLSFNVHNFSHKSKSGIFNKEIQQNTFSFIEAQNADIVCLQEFNYVGENIYASHAQLKERLGSDNYYFESYFNPKKSKVFGMATFSKFPIINKGIFEFAETRKFGTFIDVLEQNDTLRIYNIHLESVSLDEGDFAFVSNMGYRDSTLKPNSKLLFEKLRKALKIRTKQVQILKAHIEKSPYPVIVCGDFNELPSSYNYRKIATGLEDAFVQNGSGFGKTFSVILPVFRIDYILFDPRLTSTYYQEFKTQLSDHYPIKAKLYYN